MQNDNAPHAAAEPVSQPTPSPAHSSEATTAIVFPIQLAEMTVAGVRRLIRALEAELVRRGVSPLPASGNVVPLSAVLPEEAEERRLERMSATELDGIARKLSHSINHGGLA